MLVINENQPDDVFQLIIKGIYLQRDKEVKFGTFSEFGNSKDIQSVLNLWSLVKKSNGNENIIISIDGDFIELEKVTLIWNEKHSESEYFSDEALSKILFITDPEVNFYRITNE